MDKFIIFPLLTLFQQNFIYLVIYLIYIQHVVFILFYSNFGNSALNFIREMVLTDYLPDQSENNSSLFPWLSLIPSTQGLIVSGKPHSGMVIHLTHS